MVENPELMKKTFLYLQILLGVLFLGILYWRFGRGEESGFGSREADRKRNWAKNSAKSAGLLADARLSPKKNETKRPLQLEGIRIDGAPHEILGVSEDASKSEIQKAHKVLITRYHPDRVGRPGSREWADAQKIAEAINSARDHLISRAKR